jgi:sulfur-oxidizing protein SoxB
LLPVHFREPSVNLGIGGAAGKAPHLVGEHLLKAFGIKPGGIEAHAFTYLNFETAARTYGKVGGFAHLSHAGQASARARPGALLLDGGDTWQGSATCAVDARAQDMVDACKLLGVDMMTAALGVHLRRRSRVQEIVEKDLRKSGQSIDFVAQNVKTSDFGDRGVQALRAARDERRVGRGHRPGLPLHADRQPRAHFVPDWSFGIQDDNVCRRWSTRRAAKGAQVVVLLSHNGMDVDLKMARACAGSTPSWAATRTMAYRNRSNRQERRRQTLVTNAGSNGKFLGVLDFDVKHGKVSPASAIGCCRCSPICCRPMRDGRR